MKNSSNNWALPLLIGVCALGAGVTGTLLWTQSQRPATSNATANSITNPAPNAPFLAAQNAAPSASSPAESAPHEPPASLTAGLNAAQTALTLGNWYYDHQAWPQAEKFYRSAISQGIDNSNVRTDLGSALRFSGDGKGAIEQYQRAQQEDPKHENSLFNQGGVYASELNQPAKAIEVWRKYLRVFPNGQNVDAARQLIREAQKKLDASKTKP